MLATHRCERTPALMDKDMGILGVDMKCTGPRCMRNGAFTRTAPAAERPSGDLPFSLGCVIRTGANNPVEKGRLTLSLYGEAARPESDEDWKALWKERGFDMDTLESFWLANDANRDALNDIQDPDSDEQTWFTGIHEYANAIVHVLRSMETRFGEKWVVVFDAPMFDPSIVNNLLVGVEGERSLRYLQAAWECHADGALPIDEYLEGLYGLAPRQKDNKNRRNELVRHFEDVEREFRESTEAGSHKPEEDAEHMMDRLFFFLARAPLHVVPVSNKIQRT